MESRLIASGQNLVCFPVKALLSARPPIPPIPDLRRGGCVRKQAPVTVGGRVYMGVKNKDLCKIEICISIYYVGQSHENMSSA